MDQEGGVLKINIYGTEYPIKSDSETDSEYIRQVAEYVDSKMREIDQNTQAKSSLKVAILAALNITDELFQERELNKSLLKTLEGKIKNLSSNLDHTLRDFQLNE
ncbi:cell division protein ZapA [candidate division KSB1 bacterium]|nr:cell division protein ZapA [candidate division KSB1 bacterium]